MLRTQVFDKYYVQHACVTSAAILIRSGLDRQYTDLHLYFDITVLSKTAELHHLTVLHVTVLHVTVLHVTVPRNAAVLEDFYSLQCLQTTFSQTLSDHSNSREESPSEVTYCISLTIIHVSKEVRCYRVIL